MYEIGLGEVVRKHGVHGVDDHDNVDCEPSHEQIDKVRVANNSMLPTQEEFDKRIDLDGFDTDSESSEG